MGSALLAAWPQELREQRPFAPEVLKAAVAGAAAPVRSSEVKQEAHTVCAVRPVKAQEQARARQKALGPRLWKALLELKVSEQAVSAPRILIPPLGMEYGAVPLADAAVW